jgi:phage shock protein A
VRASPFNSHTPQKKLTHKKHAGTPLSAPLPRARPHHARPAARGGPVRAEANLFARVVRVFRSYANAIGECVMVWWGGTRARVCPQFLLTALRGHLARSHHPSTHLLPIFCFSLFHSSLTLSPRSLLLLLLSLSLKTPTVSAAEDPEKMLDQTVNEMQADLIKMRQASAQVLASQKQVEAKYNAAQSTADEWYRRAELAAAKGDDDLAREALTRRKAYQANADTMKAQLDAQRGAVDQLIANTKVLETKLVEAKSKKDTLKARARSAATSKQVAEMVSCVFFLCVCVLVVGGTREKEMERERAAGKTHPSSPSLLSLSHPQKSKQVQGLDTSNAVVAFERMEEKVMALEAESEATLALAASDETERKFKALEGGSGIDSELAALKAKTLGGGRVPPPSLPAGRVPDAIDFELEELRRKAAE